MKRVSHIFVALLCLILGMTPFAAIKATGPQGQVFSLVICSDGAEKTISLDEDGNPVNATHSCVDCCLVFATATPRVDLPAAATAFLKVAGPRVFARHTSVYMQFRPWTRGPPSVV